MPEPLPLVPLDSDTPPDQLVDITRFWAPLAHAARLSESGYLAESYSLFGVEDADRAADEELTSTRGLGEARGLILLGPPGSGKSVELARLHQAASENDVTIVVELGAIADAQDLRREITEHPAFTAWHEGRSRLTLVLDSIDEGVLSVENLATILGRALRGGPGETLRCRLTCRAAEWTLGLERELRSVLGDDEVRKLTLAPLRARDAREIAQVRLSGDTDAFLEEVVRSGAASLAALPLTLSLLIRVFRRNGGQLPKEPAQLFEKATLYLCEELNVDRRDARRTGSHDPAVRHALATRIAGLLRLSGKTHLNLRASAVDSEDALALKDLRAPPDTPATSLPLDCDAARDLVRHSGLFEASGPDSFRFVHAALGEFLAARFLKFQNTPPATAMALLCHRDGELLPQLRQVASWLAALDEGFFELMAERDAEAALTYVAEPSVAHRRALLGALLRGANRGAVDAYEVDRAVLARLDHEGIGEALRSVLDDPKQSVGALRLVIAVVDALEVRAAVPSLLRLALDASAPVIARYNAVYVAESLGTEQDLAQLTSLSETPRQEDPARRVAMAARHALFPRQLTVHDLMAIAKRDAAADDAARASGERPPPAPLERTLSGSPGPHIHLLRTVLQREAPELPDERLHEDLGHFAGLRGPDEYERVAATALAEAAVARLSDGRTAAALGELVVGRESGMDPVWRRFPMLLGEVSREIEDDVARRRALVEAVVRSLAARARELEGEAPVLDHVSFTVRQDLVRYSEGGTAWYLEQLQREADPVARTVWYRLVEGATAYSDRETWEPVLEACLSGSSAPELLEIYRRRYAAQEIEGPQADADRARQREWDEIAATREAKRVPHTVPLPDQLDLTLDDDTLRPAESMGRVLDLLALDPKDARRQGVFESLRPARSSLWMALDNQRKERLVALAREVVESAPSRAPQGGSREERVYLESIAMLAQTGAFDPDLVPDAALAWLAATLLVQDYSFADEVSHARDALRDAAWRGHKDDLVERLLVPAEHPGHARTILSHVLPSWDNRLCGPLMAAAHRLGEAPGDGSSSYDRRSILDHLISLRVEAAVDAAIEDIAPLVEPDAPKIDEAETDAMREMRWRSAELFLLAPTQTWGLLRERYDTDDDFAEGWLRSLAGQLHRHQHAWPDVDAELIGHIFRRLHALVPPSEDVERPAGAPYSSSTSDHVSRMRRTLIGALTSRASAEDVALIRALHAECPELDLQRDVTNAERQHRVLTPDYPSPADVLRAVADPLLLPIRSEAELQRAVVDALDRIQKRIAEDMQRDAAIFWETAGKKKEDGLRPRDENYISDRLATMLRDRLEARGITVNREPESNRYDRTDILVEAPPDPARGRHEHLAVVVEVKGSWNEGVLTALSEQLAGRYLASSGLQHGIYLVVWFDPKHWAPGDRKRRSTKNAPELERTLLEQAYAASGYTIAPAVLRVPAGW